MHPLQNWDPAWQSTSFIGTWSHLSLSLVPGHISAFHWYLVTSQSFTGNWSHLSLSLVPGHISAFHWYLVTSQSFTAAIDCSCWQTAGSSELVEGTCSKLSSQPQGREKMSVFCNMMLSCEMNSGKLVMWPETDVGSEPLALFHVT